MNKKPTSKPKYTSLEPIEHPIRGPWNRFLQLLARIAPGAQTVRVFLHRMRGVEIGPGVWLGYDVILDTSAPDLISIGEGTSISMRTVIIAHFKEVRGVKIGRDVFIGPGVIVLPNVHIGDGSVIKAGSVVSMSVPPKTIVEGNPAVPVARCETPLYRDITFKEFAKGVRSLNASTKIEPVAIESKRESVG